MKFPQYRPRRLRKDELFRRMIRETHLRPDDLILPLFVRPGKRIETAHLLHARAFSVLHRSPGQRGEGGQILGDPWHHPLSASPKRRMNWDQKPMPKMGSFREP